MTCKVWKRNGDQTDTAIKRGQGAKKMENLNWDNTGKKVSPGSHTCLISNI